MLTSRLRDCLKQGGPGSKVIIVSSGGAYTAPLVVKAMDQPPADMDCTVRYAHDKRRQIAMAERFADEFLDDGIGVYTYHPGARPFHICSWRTISLYDCDTNQGMRSKWGKDQQWYKYCLHACVTPHVQVG